MEFIRKILVLAAILPLLSAPMLKAEVFSAQCADYPTQDSGGDWSHNPGTETWNQEGEIPAPSDEVWINGGRCVQVFDGWHTVSKLEMRSNASGSRLEVSGGALQVTGIAKFEGAGNSIVVSGGSLTIYWAYGGIDGLQITSGSFEIEGANWDTIVNLSQSGGEVVLHSLDIAGPGGYVFEYGSTGILKVETSADPETFFGDYIDDEIARPSDAEWVYGTETINGSQYATLSIK